MERRKLVNRVSLKSYFYRNSVKPWNYRQKNKYRTNRRVGRKDQVLNGFLDYHEEPEVVETAGATAPPPPLGRKLQRVASAKCSVDLRPSFISDYTLPRAIPCISRFSSGPFRKVILPKIYHRVSFGIISRPSLLAGDPSLFSFPSFSNSIATIMRLAPRNNLISVSIVDNIT